MGAVVADTQSITWYFLDGPRLSPAGKEAIEGALRAGDLVCVSAITLVELVYLTERGRVPDEALESLPRDAVPGMPDRIIAATALYLRKPLVTSDSRIRRSGIETIW